MKGWMILGISILFGLFFNINSIFGDSVDTSEQITLSKDLQNNSVAQDILKKIEKSKRWIAQIEQRNFEESERQKELEEKRTEVLQILEQDLKKWEDLWEYSTFDKILERALENSPAKDTASIYDHPLKFTASKINAGREALQNVLLQGGGPEEARAAFAKAAKITRAEMISANSLFNIIHYNAYYNQQILFDSDGNFNLELSGKELRKYYQDYRANPEYLQANPFDKISWKDLGKNNPSTKCRQEHVLVYRTTADDYVCTTEYTAEMWKRHNMGILVTDTFLESKDSKDVQQFQQDRIFKKVKNINTKIQSLQEHYEKKLDDTKRKYDSLFFIMNIDKKTEEKKLFGKLIGNHSISKEQMSNQITNIREKYAQLEQNTTDEKSRVLEILKLQHTTSVNNLVKDYESDSELKITWNQSNPIFEAEMSLS